MEFSIHDIYGKIFKIWRERRFALFLDRIKPSLKDTILDVGGLPGTWIHHKPCWASVETLNVYPVDWDPSSAPEHRIRTLVGDGCKLEFPDHHFDIVFSNSVIEHVGDFARQKAFAEEARRVGKRLWIQTPAWECPFEPHYLSPFVHYLPRKISRKVVRWITLWGLIQKPSQTEVDEMIDSIRLLRKKEMLELFPDCQIHTEYLLGIIPKSYIAIRTGIPDAATAPFTANQQDEVVHG